jgi:uncharacterized glyoxalase superfamily protein PhnB
MIGNVRTVDPTSALAAALDSAALSLRRFKYRLWAGVQVRLNLAGAAPRSNLVGASVIPTVRYRDVPAAVEWLCRAFGMKVHRVVTDAHGAARYAELTVGAGMLMVAPIEDTAFGKLMVQPDEIGGVETQVCYLCVGDARTHSARAKAAGAVIIIEPDDEVNKGRGYSCRDPEGHVWNFGTYDPWGKLLSPVPAPRPGLGRVQQAVAAAVVLAVAATLSTELMPQPSARAGTAIVTPQAPALPAEEVPAKTAVPTSAKADAAADDEAPAREAHAQRAALEAAEKAAAEARAQLAEARGALAKAEREATAARSQLDDLQRAKLAADRAAEEARTHLASIQNAAERARAEVALERSKRYAAVRAAVRARRRASVPSMRWRAAASCYNAYGQLMLARSRGRLYVYCMR